MSSSDVTQFLATLPPALTCRGNGRSDHKTVTKRIRDEIALAIKRGVIPTGTKVSVRSDHNSIHVQIVAWVGAVFSSAYEEGIMDPAVGWPVEKQKRWHAERQTYVDARHTDSLADALWAIHRIADRHNYNNSDYMTDYHDVGYYLSVDAHPLESGAVRGVRLQFDTAFRELCDRAQRASEALGPRVTESVIGRHGLEQTSNEFSMKRLIAMAERANGRPLVYDKRKGWIVATDPKVAG
jgi:hypothetical protein